MRDIRLGDRGPAVIDIRVALQALSLIPSGEAALDLNDPNAQVFDGACALAVREFQQVRKLPATGEVDEDTYRELNEARYQLGDRILLYTPQRMMRGDDVSALQDRLSELGYYVGNVDGILGSQAATALIAFQRDYGLVADGTCGPDTLRAFGRLGSKVVGGSAPKLRANVQRRAAGPTLHGKRVTIDAGHSAMQPGIVVGELRESDIVWDIAARLEARLSMVGAHVTLTRGPRTTPSREERAAIANEQSADLFFTLHCAANDDLQHGGLTVSYFGNARGYSHVGEEFAGLVHRELVARAGFTDRGLHARNLELLRLTYMPAVHVECGYLTNQADRARLGEARTRDSIADGCLAAIQRFYLMNDDVTTGTWYLPAEARQALIS